MSDAFCSFVVRYIEVSMVNWFLQFTSIIGKSSFQQNREFAKVVATDTNNKTNSANLMLKLLNLLQYFCTRGRDHDMRCSHETRKKIEAQYDS